MGVVSSDANLSKLPEEILDRILEFFAPYYAKPFTIDKRSSLSVQSEDSDRVNDIRSALGVQGGIIAPAAEEQGEVSGRMIDWLLISRSFCRTGRRRRFASIAIRCSLEGLDSPDLESQSLRYFLDFKYLSDTKTGLKVHPPPAHFVRKLSLMVYGYSSLHPHQFESLRRDAAQVSADYQRQIDERMHLPQAARERRRPTDHQLRVGLERSRNDKEIIEKMMRRTADYRRIIREGTDYTLILKALQTFDSSLEQVRLMRVENAIDRGWEAYLKGRPDLLTTENRHSRWTRACEHVAQILGRALQQSNCRPPRLSGRALSPQTCLCLSPIVEAMQTTDPGFASNLNCLELQFDNRANLDEQLDDLPRLFQRGFTTAVNIQGLHIGFSRPTLVKFEEVFHDVHWENLRYIGLGAWKLNASDIIGFVRRHRRSLKSIRLRGVLLNEGSRWIDILKVFRRELNLTWVSLRRVGYSALEPPIIAMDDYDEDSSHDSDGDWYETESESGSDGDLHHTASQNGNLALIETQSTDGDQSHDADHSVSSQVEGSAVSDVSIEGEYLGMHDSDYGSDADSSEDGEAVNDNGIDDRTMVAHSDLALETITTCNCAEGYAWDDLKDDYGMNPTSELWKSWQEWATIKRCHIHDPRI